MDNWYKKAKLVDKGVNATIVTQCANCKRWATINDSLNLTDSINDPRDPKNYIWKTTEELSKEEKDALTLFYKNQGEGLNHKGGISHGICRGCMVSEYGFTEEEIDDDIT